MAVLHILTFWVTVSRCHNNADDNILYSWIYTFIILQIQIHVTMPAHEARQLRRRIPQPQPPSFPVGYWRYPDKFRHVIPTTCPRESTQLDISAISLWVGIWGASWWLHTKTTSTPFNPKEKQFNSRPLLGIQPSQHVPKEALRHCATKPHSGCLYLQSQCLHALMTPGKKKKNQVVAKKINKSIKHCNLLVKSALERS